MQALTRLHLKRTAILREGAFGMLLLAGLPLVLTLERTYDGARGAQMVKIAPGEYKLKRTWFHRGGYDTWQVLGGDITPERRILFHRGTVERHSEGCILVGNVVDFPMLGGGTDAFKKLMTATSGAIELDLIVSNV